MGERVKLSDGRTAPLLAFGTFKIANEKAAEALRVALDTGYRLIDTAQIYANEEVIGDVLHEYFSQGKLKREDVFVTTKLWNTYLAKADVRRAVEDSLRKLQLDCVDLLLIHQPWGFKNHGDGTMLPTDQHGNYDYQSYDLTETWQELETLVSEGKIVSLGISNFNSVQLDRIHSFATVKPVVNQVECHPYLPQKELYNFCEKRGILIQAYAPLGSPDRPKGMSSSDKLLILLKEPVLKTIGDKYSKSPAQVLIRDLLQRGIMVAVKSVTPSRIKENFQVFDFALSTEDMAEIDKLCNGQRFFDFLLFAKGHPDYPFNIPF
ncbi:hypothetical protein ACOMHN_041678 [Nucella lapillus]